MLPLGFLKDRRLRINWEDGRGSNVGRRGHLHVFGLFLRFSIIPPRVPEVSPYTLLKLAFAPIITFDNRVHFKYTLRLVWVAWCPKNVVKQHLREAPRFLHVDLQPRRSTAILPICL
jgi:hypothetical protein